MSKIYIAASWKQRERVNKISKELSSRGHVVFDFTDNASRAEVNRHMCLDFPIYATSPKATYPERYDPTKQKYGHYLREMHEYDDVMKNNLAIIKKCDVCILLLPAGADSHADWGACVGASKITCVVGYPESGERSPCHLWADAFFQDDAELLDWFESFNDSVTRDRITD